MCQQSYLWHIVMALEHVRVVNRGSYATQHGSVTWLTSEQMCPCHQLLVLGLMSVNSHSHNVGITILLLCRNACQHQGISLGHGLHVNVHNNHTHHIGTVLGHGTCVYMCLCCHRMVHTCEQVSSVMW